MAKSKKKKSSKSKKSGKERAHTSGKRKRAIARATAEPGDGKVKINNIPLERFSTHLYRTKIKEPLLLAGDVSEEVDISVNVSGGGPSGQADATRLAVARALVEIEPSLEEKFLEYDRLLLVADDRQRETRKPNTQGKARSKRQKSYR